MRRHTGSWLTAVIVTVGLSMATSGRQVSVHAQSPTYRQTAAREKAAVQNEPILKVKSDRSDLKIIEHFAKVVELPQKITRVDGFDPAVINVTALSPTQIRVQAVAPGVTTMVLVDENAENYSVEVFVLGDVRHLQAYIDRFFPHAAVQAVAVRDSVVLRGWVVQPATITELVEIAEQFYPKVLNQMRVGGAQQVLLKVKVLEVQRARMRQLGFNFLYVDRNGFLSSTPGDIVRLSGITAPFGGPPEITVNTQQLAEATIVGGIVRDNFIFQGFLEALKQEALLKILAEPTMVSTNGRPANMLAGGEFPILVPQSLGTTTIEWREFGVRLEAVPIMLGSGRVRLELQPEVSERDFSNAVEISGLTVPGLTTRRVNTQVEMKFGETFVLAGLLSSRMTAETDKVPFLGELPWIGAAFRRVRYDEDETELVIMVTPELVAPLQKGQMPKGGPGLFTDVPTDHELFLDGMLEVPRYGNECEGCGEYPTHLGTPSGTPLKMEQTPGPQPQSPEAKSTEFGVPSAVPEVELPARVGSTEIPRWSHPENYPTTADATAFGPSGQPASARYARPGMIEPRPGLIGPPTFPNNLEP